MRDVHQEEAGENDSVDENLQGVVGDITEEKEADGLSREYAEIHPANKREVGLPAHKEALYGVAAACEQQHDGDGEFWLVEEHEQRRRDDNKAEPRDRLDECREKDSQRWSCVCGDTGEIMLQAYGPFL